MEGKYCADDKCSRETPVLKGRELQDRVAALGPGWAAVSEHHLEREFTFKNFRDALAFTNRLGELAEQRNHHPDIFLAWGKVKVTLWTHAAGGITELDLALAAAVNELAPKG